MNTIRILPENVASQIAAGEVVDRPASVVRELIDNSIDAGADRIVVKIENGGKRRIRVSDNGKGMSKDDLLLCVERHATSKIQTASDLLTVQSLGFRGEALPSIAAVSRVQITSLAQGELIGHRLKISGGKLLAMEEAGAPNGTAIAVGDLFFNIPARRKFLRAARTETHHIVDILSRIAMPFPKISFSLEEGGRHILNLRASSDMFGRLSGLLGRKVAEAMLTGTHKDGDLSVEVHVAPSDASRNRADRLYVYVNKRNIRDRFVTRAIMEGYGRRLMKGQFPQVVAFIEVDPQEIDVNVHPAKQEIRFRNPSRVFQSIVSAIGNALAGLHQPLTGTGFRPRPTPAAPVTSQMAVSDPPWAYVPGPPLKAAPEPIAPPETVTPSAPPVIVGQLGNTYILCETTNGLMIVDQHAAHERIVYEHLRKSIADAHIEAQTLLIPQELEFSAKETRVLLEMGEKLRPLGIELDHFGGNSFLLRAVPALLKRVEWQPFLSELISDYAENASDPTDLFDASVMLMACHGAIRAGQSLTQEEMTRLVTELGEMDLPTNCPHGRPIFRQLTFREMERMFKRVV